MSVSANRIWRQMPEEIRIAASKLFWAEPKGAGRQIVFASLAKAKNLREVTVRKTPIEKLANWTAVTLSLPDQIVDELLKNYLLHEVHRRSGQEATVLPPSSWLVFQLEFCGP